MELEVKLKRKYESKTETLVLINYKRDLRRCVNITYPRDWDCEKLDVFIQNFHDVNVRKPLYVSEWSSLLMKNRLEEIKKLGYRVIAINQLHGYIVRKDGKFLSYQLAKYTSEGGISLTYKYVPSRTHGSGAIQGGESGYNFGFTEFSKEMLNDMMDHPKLYGKVEHYKDFNEYRQLNAGLTKSLKKQSDFFWFNTIKYHMMRY